MSSERIPARASASFLHPGIRMAQEDHVLVLQDRGIFVAADGFGGPLAGTMAAKASCEAVRDFLVKEAGDLDATLPFVLRSYFSLAGNVLFNALMHANRKVHTLNKGKTVHERGGASVIAGFIDGDLLAVANVGACGAWLIRDGQCVDLILPRTYGRLADPLSEDSSPQAAVPLMAVGIGEDLEPEIAEYRIRPGDWVIFHTDGLQSSCKAILASLQASGTPPEEAIQRASEALASMAYSDNAGAAMAIF